MTFDVLQKLKVKMVKDQGYSVKTSSDRQIIDSFRKWGSLNLMAMSEYRMEAED